MKIVKVGRVGKKVIEVCLNDNAIVDTALIAAGVQPFNNEDIWLNHRIVNKNVGVISGDTIILEPRKVTVSQKTLNFVDYLIDEAIIDEEYQENDENNERDLDETYRLYQGFIDEIIRKAKAI